MHYAPLTLRTTPLAYTSYHSESRYEGSLFSPSVPRPVLFSQSSYFCPLGMVVPTSDLAALSNSSFEPPKLYSPDCVEGAFYELRPNGVLGSPYGSGSSHPEWCVRSEMTSCIFGVLQTNVCINTLVFDSQRSCWSL
jgi:hypothetical protein